MSDAAFHEIEPSAEMRQFAANVREQYVALRKEGFSEQQALVIVGQVIAALLGRVGGSDE